MAKSKIIASLTRRISNRPERESLSQSLVKLLTKFVTLGGAIASDIHGKNHHKEGSFSNHVLSLELMLEDGSIAYCSREDNQDLFLATCGGMGLTGIILLASVQLKKVETSFIRQETLRAENIDHLMDLFESSKDWTYSVSWVDALSKGKALGRGILFRGEHAQKKEIQIKNPGLDYLELKKKKNIRCNCIVHCSFER